MMTEDVTDDIFADAVAGLDQARAHLRREPTPGLVLHVPAGVDVAAIRRATGLSQPVFATSIGVRVDTLRQWEQGRRQPQGPARVLLAMLAKNPCVVAETLGRHNKRASGVAGLNESRPTAGRGSRRGEG